MQDIMNADAAAIESDEVPPAPPETAAAKNSRWKNLRAQTSMIVESLSPKPSSPGGSRRISLLSGLGISSRRDSDEKEETEGGTAHATPLDSKPSSPSNRQRDLRKSSVAAVKGGLSMLKGYASNRNSTDATSVSREDSMEDVYNNLPLSSPPRERDVRRRDSAIQERLAEAAAHPPGIHLDFEVMCIAIDDVVM